MTLTGVSHFVFGLLFIPNVATTEKGLRDLAYSEDGLLVFSQLLSEVKNELAPLYHVKVNLDIEEMNVKTGMSMVFDKQKHVMQLNVGLQPADALAWGYFDDSIETNGWSSLWVDTSASTSVSNDVKMYAAGYIEGLMTCVRLSEYYANTHLLLMKDEERYHALLNIKGMIGNEIGYVKMKSNIIPHIMTEEPADSYWKHVRYLLFQTWGLADGYNFAATHFNVHTLGLEDIFLINSGGELPDLMQAYSPMAVSGRIAAQAPSGVFLQESMKRGTRREKPSRAKPAGKRPLRGLNTNLNTSADSDPLSDANWEKRLQADGHCSAFVRLGSNNADLFVGHTTWDDYSEMTRIFKYYNFPLGGADTMAQTIAMSSYPGLVSSTDDYYIMNSGLAVMDTTMEILDPFIWDKVTDFPTNVHIPNFMHVMATNRLAKSPPQWARIYGRENTGTYNAQWMIVDYNQFSPGKTLPDNTLWVVESIPGAIHSQDVSPVLRKQGYWASFNRPYFDDIRLASGHDAAMKSHGNLYSFNDSPRGHIFASVAPSVEGLLDMRGLMDRNMYPYAGVEPNEPGHEISARMDLSPTQPIPNGGIDAKVTNYCLFKTLAVQAISGPSHINQPVFSWTKEDGIDAWPGYPHAGQPNTWNFDWVQMTPAAQATITDVTECP